MKLKRVFYIFKCRTHVLMRNLAEKFFKVLAKLHLVVEHRKRYSNVRDLTSPQIGPDICRKRFVFEVSYVDREIELVDEYWFANKKGKKLFVVWENRHKEGRLSFRLRLKSFYAHFSPRCRMWVHRNTPVVYIPSELKFNPSLYGESIDKIEVKTHQCDFSRCDYAFEFSYAFDLHTNGLSPEVLSQSYRAISNGVSCKIPNINKTLTGVLHDGEMMSPKNMPMVDNLLCRKCGLPLFASAADKYKFECLAHGDLEYEWVRRVDPVEYQKVLSYTMDTLEALIQKSCPQDYNL